MTPKDIRTAISNQCGFNKAKHRQDLQVKLSPERLAQLESICQNHPNKAVQVCNAGDWPTVEDQQRYWQDLDDPGGNIIPSRVQANHDRYDNERHPFA